MTSFNKLFKSKFPYSPPDDQANLGSFLLDAFDHNHDKVLFYDCANEREWTGSQMKEATVRVASGLMDQCRLSKGDVVFMMCPHSDHEIIFCIGALLTGAIVYGSSCNDGYNEHLTLCNMVKPKVLVGSYRLHHEMFMLTKNIEVDQSNNDGPIQIVWIDDSERPLRNDKIEDDEPYINNDSECNNNNNNNNQDSQAFDPIGMYDVVSFYDDLIDYKHQHLNRIKDVLERQIDGQKDGAFLVLTSGSTGKPKAVYSTHYTTVAHCHALIPYPRSSSKPATTVSKSSYEGTKDYQSISDGGRLWNIDENSIIANNLPLDHQAGTVSMFISVYFGAKTLIIQSYDCDIFWKNVSKFRVTDCMASTTNAYKFLSRFKTEFEAGNKFYTGLDISSLRYICGCGSKLDTKEVIQYFNKNYPHMTVCQAYGCTETGYIATTVRGKHHGYQNSVGFLVGGVIAKIVDLDSGELLGINKPGELRIKCPGNYLRYYGNEKMLELTEATYDSDRFYKTGDQAYFDEDERLYILGRYKEVLFLDEDWKILPKEIEDVVLEHPLVEECCIVGMPDPDLPNCHAPRAYIKLFDGVEGIRTDLTKENSSTTNTNGQNGTYNGQEDNSNGDLKMAHSKSKVTDKEIFNFVKERVAKPKYLRGGIRFVEEFPRNGVLAKIDRKKLLAMP